MPAEQCNTTILHEFMNIYYLFVGNHSKLTGVFESLIVGPSCITSREIILSICKEWLKAKKQLLFNHILLFHLSYYRKVFRIQ